MFRKKFDIIKARGVFLMSNGLIYAIKNETTPDVYIGSTTQELKERWYVHKSLNHRCSSKKILECPTAYIEYIEGCDIDKMKEREQYWIDNTPNCINKIRTTGEYFEANKKEYYKNHTVKWRNDNRERFNEWQREYRAKKKATVGI